MNNSSDEEGQVFDPHRFIEKLTKRIKFKEGCFSKAAGNLQKKRNADNAQLRA